MPRRELVVEHPRVGDLARERNADAGAQRVGVDRGAAGGEEDRAAAGVEHRAEHRLAAATAPRTLNSSGPRTSSTVVSRIGFMNSLAGSGEYSSTSTGPSRSASVGDRLRQRGGVADVGGSRSPR